MTIEQDALDYVLDTYGHCDRDNAKQNDCYWGKDNFGHDNGCLKVEWLGRSCPHWHSVSGSELQTLVDLHSGRF